MYICETLILLVTLPDRSFITALVTSSDGLVKAVGTAAFLCEVGVIFGLAMCCFSDMSNRRPNRFGHVTNQQGYRIAFESTLFRNERRDWNGVAERRFKARTVLAQLVWQPYCRRRVSNVTTPKRQYRNRNTTSYDGRIYSSSKAAPFSGTLLSQRLLRNTHCCGGCGKCCPVASLVQPYRGENLVSRRCYGGRQD